MPKITTIEENIQYLLMLKLIIKRDVKDKIKMKGIDNEDEKTIKRMAEAIDSGIKYIESIQKYEKALKIMAESYCSSCNSGCPEYYGSEEYEKKDLVDVCKKKAGLGDKNV